MILEEGPSLPVPSAAGELLSVSVQIMFCTAVGDSVWDKLPPQFHLLIFFKNYPCADLPTRLWMGRGGGHWPLKKMRTTLVENGQIGRAHV